jgi:hypothetical protein
MHLSSFSACNQLMNNFTSLFCFIRCVTVFHYAVCNSVLFYQNYCQQTTPKIPEVLSTKS